MAIVEYAVARSMLCGEADPRTLRSSSFRPRVSSGIPASMAASRVLCGPTSRFSATYAVFIEYSVARTSVTFPNE